LRRIRPSISCEEDTTRANVKLNLALTFQGLCTLGLTKEELELFPREFQEGLEQRAGLLGDVGLNHPERWSLPEANWPENGATYDPIRLSLVDAVLNLQTKSDSQSHELLDALAQFLVTTVEGPELEILHVQPTRRFDDRGHLGAVDGVSQPVATGESVPPYDQRDVVPVGELLLGYENRANEPSSVPEALRLNSTFIAIRKMSQDPEVYAGLGQSQLELALGRKLSGENLIDPTTANGFDYQKTGSEQKCPFFSHVRRANPRADGLDGAVPRILRRGMSYGPRYQPDTRDNPARGVMFLAIAASLAEQYEVVQRWVNGGNSTGGFSGHPDLIAGTHPSNSGRQLRYPTASGVAAVAVPAKPAAVLNWGLYAFIPSISALESLAHYPRPSYLPTPPPAQHEPPPVPDQFGALPLSKKGDAAKARLEDVFRPKVTAERLTKLLKGKGIAKEDDFAWIAGAPEIVAKALTSPEEYSVRNYWARMRACDATLYLGMDRDPKTLTGDKFDYAAEVKPGDYENESGLANQFIAGIGFAQAFEAATDAAATWFAEQEAHYQGLAALLASLPKAEQAAVGAALDQPQTLSLVALAARVIRDVACKLYGLPQDLLSDDLDLEWPASAAPATARTAVRCPVDLTSVFAHVFPPRPSYAVSLEAKKRGPLIKERITAWYRNPENQALVANSELIQRVSGAATQSGDFVVRTIIGLLSGFAVPTNGSLLSVLSQLVATDELWRLQRLLPTLDPTLDVRSRMQPITNRVYELMIQGPVPAMITRTAMIEEKGLKQGDLVGLHLGVAAALAKPAHADAWKFLFGDLPETMAGSGEASVQAKHPCPGQQMALGVIVGTVYALLTQRRLKKEPLDSLTLTKYA
jgi:hypothetical protein